MASDLLRRSGISVGMVCERLKWRPDLVVQAGIGLNHEEVAVLHKEWPECRFIGYEPHPDIAKKAAKTYPGRIVAKALSDVEGTLCLREKKCHKDGSSLLQFSEDIVVSRYLDIPVTMLDLEYERGSLCGCECRVLLWLDCEGCELRAMSHGLRFVRERVDVINIEMTPSPPGPDWPSTMELHEKLTDMGFLRQHIHTQRHQNQYDAVYVRPHLFNPRYCCCPYTINEYKRRGLEERGTS